MIRFQDTAEKKDASHSLSSAAFRDIKSKGTISNEEALSFLEKLFSVDPEGREVHLADEEDLLTEIFGRYEDEFVFDFEIDDEIQAVIDRFSASKWGELPEDKRIEAISDLSSVISKRLGVDKVPEIRFYGGRDNSCGAYLPGENIIEINRNTISDPKEIVDTVAHEMRHAYQHQRAALQETHMDTLYKVNFENYIAPIPLADGKYMFFTDYQDQLVEAEARAFANLFTRKEGA